MCIDKGLTGRILDDSDSPREECGVFGIYRCPNAAEAIYYGLHALQHRGQESSGIVVSDSQSVMSHKGMGLVSEVFPPEKLGRLQGHMGIGHVRYTTSGDSRVEEAQPLTFRYRVGALAIAHNGNLVNAYQIRRYLERQGSIFQTSNDTEVIAHLIARSAYDEMELAFQDALSMIKGAYAILLMTEDKMIAAVDPHGLRPLSLGRIDENYVLASETCAFDIAGAEFVRDINPGEMLVIDESGLASIQFAQPSRRATCSFEYIYFARPDSDIAGKNVHLARKALGRHLAAEHPVEADIVTGVPDSSLSAAMGYAEAAGLPYEMGLLKNRYVGRTFIQPTQPMRTRGVMMKLSAIRQAVEGKRVVMVDDSIVRGTTSSRIVNMLREAGASEVHVRISSPPVANPCYYGIDTSSRDELIVTSKTIPEIESFIGADSLAFLSVPRVLQALGCSDHEEESGLCLACFTGTYPTEIYPETLEVSRH